MIFRGGVVAVSKTILLVAKIGLAELNRRPQIVPYKLVALAGSATLLKICFSYYFAPFEHTVIQSPQKMTKLS